MLLIKLMGGRFDGELLELNEGYSLPNLIFIRSQIVKIGNDIYDVVMYQLSSVEKDVVAYYRFVSVVGGVPNDYLTKV